MQCNEARIHLFGYADGTLSESLSSQMAAHLAHCSSCSQDYQVIADLTGQSALWHELPVPRWQPPRMTAPFNAGAWQQWFPSLASALALVLVVGLYLKTPMPVLPPAAAAPTGYSAAATPAALPINASLEGVQASNRLERQQELQALVALLRAEMDRRNEETEESLRYVIAHQIQGQREIDDLYQYIRKVSRSQTGSQEPVL